MTDLQLYSEISSLPSNLKQEVSEFVAFLKQKSRQKNKTSLANIGVEEPEVIYKSKLSEILLADPVFTEEQIKKIEETRKSISGEIMETIIVHPKNEEQLIALKAVMRVLNIDFQTEKSPYNPEFVKEILQSREDFKNGKGVKIAIEDLWK
ncbi:DUF2281 domain-containing protein [Pedobacter changchengzhani]|uniref:DUF2281 domain-containing protein n=1 Tax=Pedobacter changchengzhani TaxID=2529274 RepID=A0A4R5MMF4_9SPHI|nr:DUF2683 family protein [Pedobacter changchengzhani]TDG36854.1 DUF2281 domain-containing protein [Pedobacter changchengzhani]